MVAVLFRLNHIYQGGLGKLNYKAIFYNKSQMAFLKYDSFIMKLYKCHVPLELPLLQIVYVCSNRPAILLLIAIACCIGG